MSDSSAAAKSAFRLLAATIDEIGEDCTPNFLAKLALLLADRLADAAAFEDCVRIAGGSDGNIAGARVDLTNQQVSPTRLSGIRT